MLKLVAFTAAAIFTAEALVMLFLESVGDVLALPVRILLDCSLLMICVFPTLYFLVFKEMTEQIQLRRQAELTQSAWNQSLELVVEERTERLQRANEDLLIEVQERAKAAMSLRAALNEARIGKKQLNAIINAVRDALVVVDADWHVLVVNKSAETMFGTNAYDLQDHCLKDFLQPWSHQPADLDLFFSKDQNARPTFLVLPESDNGEGCSVQMRFGAEMEWDGKPATVLMFYCQNDISADAPQLACLT